MPQAIKSANISLSGSSMSATPYTCPADTVAKVILSSFVLTAYSAGTTQLVIGQVIYSITSGGSSYTMTFNDGVASSVSVDIAARLPSIEIYLGVGQTVFAITSAGSGLIKATMVVVEESTL